MVAGTNCGRAKVRTALEKTKVRQGCGSSGSGSGRLRAWRSPLRRADTDVGMPPDVRLADAPPYAPPAAKAALESSGGDPAARLTRSP
jgi:hypothetical protein